MKSTLVFCGVLLLLSTSLCAQDPVSVCLAMVEDAARNYGLQTSSSSFLSVIYDNYCQQDGTTKQSGWEAGMSAIVKNIPISLTGSSNDNSTRITSFCKNYHSTTEQNDSTYAVQSIVVTKALQSANECMKIATQTRSTITYSILTPQTLAIKFGIPSGQTMNIRGISHDSGVTCTGSKIGGAGAVTYDVGAGQRVDASAGTYSITCTRRPAATQGANTFYNATALVVDTNTDGVDIFWPQDTILPLTTASQIQGTISSLNSQLKQLQGTVNFNLLPIGTIVPWLVKNQDPPKGWAKCDGSDTGNCPDLRGMFLRGSASSDVSATGGNDSADIPQHGSNNRRGDGNGFSIDGNHYLSNDRVTISTVPHYTSVLYIIKVANP